MSDWEPCESCGCALTREVPSREVWRLNGAPAAPVSVHTVERCRMLKAYATGRQR